jgi:SAM-dependent methyltransferase
LSEKTTYLNLGCGGRYHPAWINIDIVCHDPQVIQHDLRFGIPLPDASCDVVYHSAVLEHIRRSDVKSFLAECHRVLKPGGIIRVGVPDLEKICQLYLAKLDRAVNNDASAACDYDWILLELYDQIVREKSGGGMLDYLRQNPLPNESFVYARIGEEGRQLVKALRTSPTHSMPDNHTGLLFRSFLHRIRREFYSLPGTAKRYLLRWLLGANGIQALEIGRFRLGGEVHQWMYDRYSLARLVRQAGFVEPMLQSATQSWIANWLDFNLDTQPDNTIIKPDSLFMEARKPV